MSALSPTVHGMPGVCILQADPARLDAASRPNPHGQELRTDLHREGQDQPARVGVLAKIWHAPWEGARRIAAIDDRRDSEEGVDRPQPLPAAPRE